MVSPINSVSYTRIRRQRSLQCVVVSKEYVTAIETSAKRVRLDADDIELMCDGVASFTSTWPRSDCDASGDEQCEGRRPDVCDWCPFHIESRIECHVNLYHTMQAYTTTHLRISVGLQLLTRAHIAYASFLCGGDFISGGHISGYISHKM